MDIRKPLLTVTKNMPILEVIQLMNQSQTSYALVLDAEKLIGIFTVRDVFSATSNQSALADITVAELMNQPVITLSATEAKNLSTVVQRFNQYGISHLPILDNYGQVLSVVTKDEVIERLSQTLDRKTADLERKVAQTEQMSKLIADKENCYQASQAIIQDILDSAIATSIVSFRIFPNREWQFDYQSPGSEALFGYTPQEILTQKNLWMSRVHPEDREKVIEPLFEEIFAERTVHVEYRFHHKDGSLRWICATYTSRYDARANCWIVTGASGDISDKKLAQKTLLEQAKLLELCHDAIIIRNLDNQITFWNQGAERIYGWTATEVMHKNSYTLLATQFPIPLEEANAGLINEGYWEGELVHFRRDGQKIVVESRWALFKQADGTPISVLEINRDISKRKQAELTLQDREAMLRGIGDNLPNAALYQVIREIDGSDRFSYLSVGCERIMEISAEAALQNSSLLYSQVIAEDVLRLQQAVEQSMQNMSVFDIQLRIITPSGQLKWLDLCSTPRKLHDGRVAWDGLMVDVTDIKQTEETLRKSEALLAESQRTARLGNWECDAATGKATWSKELFRLFNRDFDAEPNYQEILSLWQSDDGEKLQQAIEEAIATGKSYHLILRVPQSDGSHSYLEVIGHTQSNAEGKVVRLYGTAQDVTAREEALNERQRVEQALRENEAFLRSIYYGLGLSIFVVDVVDDDFRYVGLNPIHKNLTGLTADELRGKLPEEILPPIAAAAVRQHYQDCVQAGETITYEECLPFQGKDIWWITSLTPLKDENSRIYRIVGNSLNISDRKHTEQILELQAIITRNMAEGICLVRVDDGVLVYTNRKFEQMFGYEAGELIGQHVSIVNYADAQTDPQAVYEAITTKIRQNGESTYEVRNVKKDGTPFWSSGTSSVFEHPEYGTVFVTVQQDITEQKQAEDKLKASLKEKEVLLKEIHHRVKNNLGIISSLLQMQCRRIQNSQAISILHDSQNRIASIALVHEKLYASDHLSDIDFAQYILDLTTHLFKSYNFSSSNIQLNIQVEPVHLDIETAIPCGLIINELVSNALKYAFPDQPSGEIKVILYQKYEYCSKIPLQPDLVLIIRDNGVGLPADFDSKKARTMGMTLLHGLVKQLRGTVQIHNQQGTEFKIIFSRSKVEKQ
ncbi:MULTISPECIES: PAS domain S-box protein [unclassified Tolypothrix]|uniref:PAS domain S-box protein n=1 Tax=unclassified Tolypothrix TaxID=2649714 RepID=UPI0005EABF2E|nr:MULTISPECIES: PAS domain S-box protein [unclassified Tolypothrix]BAY94566.1 two-component sensor histidine kinase [Microchaete diplosiphon NIES-3275]EKE99231.1 sensor histidine kinase [Tolypothrix sp. PCC 7601]MBE9084683.1 PAS domain S-box protein [Tolypothrix sp. LEGE 11397]UYD28268.1 PAS domain S-box protein [Tolypothrix sp. PCC 7712]UYD35856.1 PAS domain S-box protein [Tolypothrix sp. PCC 7601]